MVANIEIVDMTENHIEQISLLEQECFSTPWSKKGLQEELSNNLSVFKVATKSDIVVGYVGMHNILGEGYITNICVTKYQRNLGIATLLITSLIEYGKSNNMQFISLEVRQSNEKAIALYNKFGFKKVGTRKNFYSLPKENAYIYTLYF